MEKPKVIYLKALFKKHKPENKLEKIIKDFVVQADIQVDGKEKLKVPPKDRSKVARQFILDNCEEFLAYAVDYSLYDKFFADERGTREYNLALGERRANAAKDYLMTYGISADRISVLSYGKERPVDAGSNPLAWSKNRRSVTVKAN